MTISTLPWTSPASSRGRPRFSSTRRASLTLVLEIGCRTLSAGQPTTSRGFRGHVPWLTKEGRGRGGSPFCPLGAYFQVGAVAILYRRRIRSVSSRGPVAVLPSAFCLHSCLWSLALAPLPSHAHAPSSSSKSAFLPPKMPVRLVTADDWRPSSMTERRLLELEREGLLRPRTSSSRPEWIAPAADHREPRPPTGYVVSFAKFHRHGLGAPPSRFMRALCHHYGVELQHFSPNAITVAAVFAAVCDGYLGMMPH